MTAIAALACARRAHEGDGEHVHEMTLGERGKLAESIWKVENVELTTVGIDIGSSTSHLMFACVRLQRKTQALSSQFVMVERKVLWKSPILLTPFLPDSTIDVRALGDFVRDAYRQAGLAPKAVDTGAVILTGEAVKRTNARAIADLFAADSGRFVCASAGHNLECALAAHGSGAAALSRESGRTVLNVDVGGGTTKLAWLSGGRVVATCAFAVGGRLLAFDEAGRIARIDESARLAADAAGVQLSVGEAPDPVALARVVAALGETCIAFISGKAPSALGRELLLTELAADAPAPELVAFSGGVSEYIYGREERRFGDIAPALAARIREACKDGSIATPLVEPREGIRATVIGASQFTVQVSGKTIHVSDRVRLPLRNVPVVAPQIELGSDSDAISVQKVARATRAALARHCAEEDTPVALAIAWRGDPHYRRLRELGEGLALALVARGTGAAPLVLMIDRDVGRTLGYILEQELAIGRPVVAIDGIQLKEFDYVDIGEVIRPADVVPVVIKSLLFPGAMAAGRGALRHEPVGKTRSGMR